jgi:hypothetical protein
MANTFFNGSGQNQGSIFGQNPSQTSPSSGNPLGLSSTSPPNTSPSGSPIWQLPGQGAAAAVEKASAGPIWQLPRQLPGQGAAAAVEKASAGPANSGMSATTIAAIVLGLIAVGVSGYFLVPAIGLLFGKPRR